SDALRPADHRLVAQGERPLQLARRQGRKHRQRHLAADILHRLQQAKPFAFFGGGEAVQLHRVFTDLHLDHQADMRADRQPRQGRGRTLHKIADAIHVQDDGVVRNGVHDTGELADHSPTTFRIFTVERCAWAMAAARASAASACVTPQVGSRRLTMNCTCSLPAWPAPTTHFLMWLGAYSAISSPACAAASKATARAWPILSAAWGSRATKACSTAMAVGPWF